MKKIFSIIFLFAFLGIKSQSSITPLNQVPYSGAIKSFTMGNWNGYSNNFLSKTTQITSAASVTSLTVLSERTQELIGVLTHSFNLPNATTCIKGSMIEFNNNSSGNLFVRDFTGSALKTVIPGAYVQAICTSTSSSAGQWDFHFLMPANAQYGTSGMTVNGSVVATGSGQFSGAVTTPSVYGVTSNSILNIFSNANGNGTINIGSGSSKLLLNDNLYLSNSTITPNTSGQIKYSSPTTNGFQFYSHDATQSGYHSVFSNSVNSLGFYLNTSTVTSQQGVQIGSTSNQGIGFFVNGGATELGINTNSLYITQPTRFGGSTAPLYTVDITGNLNVTSSITIGSANLTGGNTGTIGVLSDITMPYNVSNNSFNPADATTYYIFSLPQQSSSEGLFKIYLLQNYTLVGYSGTIYSGGVGSSESATLNIVTGGATTSTTNITNTANYSSVAQTFSNTSLNVNVNSGSYAELQLISPTWATNPTGVIHYFTFLFVRRK